MKKIVITALMMATLAACGGKKEEIVKPDVVSETMSRDEVRSENTNIKDEYEVADYDISNVADYNENKLRKECYIERVRYIGDPQLEELYGNLMYYQEMADEWAKFPRELEELRRISDEIGELKGEIQYRSLEVFSKVG